MTTTLTPKERKQLLIKILNDNPPKREGGQVDWQKIWQENPVWQQQLGATDSAGLSRMSVMVAHVRKSGLAPVTASTQPRGVNPRNQKPARLGWTASNEVIEKALSYKRDGGKVDFHAFIEANPDLANQFGLRAEHNLKAFRDRVGWYRRRVKKGKLTPLAVVQAPPAQVPAEAPQLANQFRPATNGHAGTEPLTARYEIYEQILAYRKQSRNYMVLALDEHPEWVERFNLKSPTRLGAFRGHMAYYERHFRKKYLAQLRGDVDPATGEEGAPPAIASPMVNICPRCGFGHFDAPTDPRFAEIFKQALDIALKMATKKVK